MWLIFAKELKELLRDRKTLFFMVALPILVFPMIFGGVGYFSVKAVQEAQSEILKYALIGGENAPEIVKGLSETEVFTLVDVDLSQDYQSLIKTEKVDFILEISENYSSDVISNGQAVVKLYLNDAGLNLVHSRVEEITSSESDRLQLLIFEKLGFDPEQQAALLNPISLEKVDVANKRESWGENIGGIVAYIIFILCLQGAMMPAADLGAGEKERGTLETLLISPVERYKIVLGKFLTIGFAGVTTALLTVSSMAIWGLVLSQGMAIKFVMEFMVAISILDFVLVFLMLIPVVAIFASLLLTLSIYARSFKEAQSYMGFLILIAIVPIIFALLPGVELKGGWAWVPLTNVALAVKELIKGTMDYFQLIAIFGSTALIAGAMITFSVYWFNQEKVLFR
jgi:sodium transport system permease protein